MKRAVAVAAIGLLGVASVPSSADDVVTKVGWWTANPLAQAPEGGGAVQRTPDGTDITVAAVRVAVGGADLDVATLVLIEDGGLRPEAADLRVCTSASDFEPVASGPRDDAPAAQCDAGSAPLVRASTGTHWNADVTALLDGRLEETLVIVSAGPGQAPPVGFEVRFRRPAVEVTRSSTTTDDTTVVEGPPPVDGPPFGGYAPDVEGPAFVPEAVAPAPSAPEVEAVPAAPTEAIVPLLSAAPGDEPLPWGRLWGFALLSVAAGAAAALGRRGSRAWSPAMVVGRLRAAGGRRP